MKIRVLGLGNDLLADDGCGLRAARALDRVLGGRADVVLSSAGGFDLLDDMAGATHLLVIDTLATGARPAGTVSCWSEADLRGPHGVAPHYVGLPEALALGRSLGLAMPREIALLTIEPADCLTVGGGMSTPVADAVSRAVDAGRGIVKGWMSGTTSEDR